VKINKTAKVFVTVRCHKRSIWASRPVFLYTWCNVTSCSNTKHSHASQLRQSNWEFLHKNAINNLKTVANAESENLKCKCKRYCFADSRQCLQSFI